MPSDKAIANPATILCIRSDRLGEFLLTLPAIALLKANYPQSRVMLLGLAANLDLVKGFPFIDGWITHQPGKGVREIRHLMDIQKKSAATAVVIFNPKKEANIASFLGRVPLRVGYNRKWGFLLNKKIEDTKYLNQTHEIDANIALVAPICPRVFVPALEFPFNEQGSLVSVCKQNRLDVKEKYVVMHPFSSDRTKEIDFEFWRRLIERIRDQGRKIVLVGLAEEYRRSPFDRLKESVQNLCGKLSLRELGNFLKFSCAFYVGVDSGPFHMAALLGKPLVVLFRKEENITRWGPYPGARQAEALVYHPELQEKLSLQIVEKLLALGS